MKEKLSPQLFMNNFDGDKHVHIITKKEFT